MELTLQVNDKEYIASEYDVSYGVAEDTIEIIDVFSLKDEQSFIEMLLQEVPNLRPLLYRIFKGITAEDVQNAPDQNVAYVFMQIVLKVAEYMNNISKDNHNTGSGSNSSSSLSLYDTLFSFTYTIAKDYKGIDPIVLRTHPMAEVFLLFRRWIKETKKKTEPDVIYREASDNWF